MNSLSSESDFSTFNTFHAQVMASGALGHLVAVFVLFFNT